MASVLSSVCQSLTAGTSISQGGFTQTAGSGRIVFVGISFESANAPETVSNPQWAGQTMTPVTDGTTTARGTAGSGFSAWVQWFQILEANLPADSGTKTFTCTLSASPNEGAICVVIVGDAAQNANVADADVYGVAGAGNPNWSVTAATDDSVAIGMAMCGNSGTFSPSAGFTEIASEQNLGSSGHQAMQGAFDTGAISATHTFSGTVNRAAAAGFVVSNGLTITDVDGSLQVAEATVSGSLNKVRDVSGALQVAEATVAGTLTKIPQVEGALDVAAATVSGSLNKVRQVDGALDTAAATVAGTLSLVTQVTGALDVAPTELYSQNSQLEPNQKITEPDATTGFLADSGTRSHTIRAGQNRVLVGIVAINDGSPSGLSLSIGGQALSLVSQTSNTNGAGITLASFELLEADFPSDGAQTLQVGFTSTEGTAWVHLAQYNNELQGGLVALALAANTFASGTLNAGGAAARLIDDRGRLVFAAIVESPPHVPEYSGLLLFGTGPNLVAGIKASDDSTGNAFRVFASEQALENSSKFCRIANDGESFGGAVPSVSLSLELRPAVDAEITGALEVAEATVAGSLSVESQVNGALDVAAATVAGELNKHREVSGALEVAEAVGVGELNKLRAIDGALTQAAATVDAFLRHNREASGALEIGHAEVAGSLQVSSSIFGALQVAAAVVAGELNKHRQIDGPLEVAELVVDGNITVGGGVVGVLEVAPAVVAGSLSVESQINGSLDVAAATVAGSTNKIRQATGALDVAALTVAGEARIATKIDGALDQAALTVAGSIDVATRIDGALSQAALTVSGSLLIASKIDGALDVAAATVAASLTVTPPTDAGGALDVAPLDVAGELNKLRQVDGALEVAELVVAGSVSTATSVQGALDVAACTVAGSLTIATRVQGALQVAAATVLGQLSLSSVGDVRTPCLTASTFADNEVKARTFSANTLDATTYQAFTLRATVRKCDE